MSTTQIAQPEKNPSANTAEGQGSDIPLGWKPTMAAPVPVVRCVQIKKDGERCKRWSLRGYTKCKRHAGPGAYLEDGNVNRYRDGIREAGMLRLTDSTDLAIDTIEFLTQPGTSEAIRLKAATEILDRAGIRGGFEVTVEAGESLDLAAETINSRLSKLAEGAQAVTQMRHQRQLEILEGEVISDTDDVPEQDIVDAVIVQDTTDELDLGV